MQKVWYIPATRSSNKRADGGTIRQQSFWPMPVLLTCLPCKSYQNVSPSYDSKHVLRTHDLQEAGISMVSHYPGIHKWSLNSTCDLSTSFYLVFSLKTSFKNSTLELSFPTHQDACTIMHRILRSRNLPIQATILRIHEVSLDFIRV